MKLKWASSVPLITLAQITKYTIITRNKTCSDYNIIFLNLTELNIFSYITKT